MLAKQTTRMKKKCSVKKSSALLRGKNFDTACHRHHCSRELILSHWPLQTHAWTTHAEQNTPVGSPAPEWRGLCSACSKEGSWLLGRSIADLSWSEPDLHDQRQSPGQGGRVPHPCACHSCCAQSGPELFVSAHPVISDKFRVGKPTWGAKLCFNPSNSPLQRPVWTKSWARGVGQGWKLSSKTTLENGI